MSYNTSEVVKANNKGMIEKYLREILQLEGKPKEEKPSEMITTTWTLRIRFGIDNKRRTEVERVSIKEICFPNLYRQVTNVKIRLSLLTQDYLRKLSLKMLTMETKYQPNAANSGQSALGPAAAAASYDEAKISAVKHLSVLDAISYAATTTGAAATKSIKPSIAYSDTTFSANYDATFFNAINFFVQPSAKSTVYCSTINLICTSPITIISYETAAGTIGSHA
ncbi:hypothetical protein RND71_026541 [Anisodus tanguticus]|uniref:Uncharacterized protein n=1 Tax=Anisodus tanguticus TaxID=243964 RepID=A0AAE1RP36_9SOLA|nr:hypothetical protein RND71_026541 [Anisodus tanguticus]